MIYIDIKDEDQNILLQSLLLSAGYYWMDSGKVILRGIRRLWVSGNEIFINGFQDMGEPKTADEIIKQLLFPVLNVKVQELNKLIEQRKKEIEKHLIKKEK